jgi:hypothetical protein
MFYKSIPLFLIISGILLLHPVKAQSDEKIIGDIRIQALSENLIRIEQKGPQGFEDRSTFTVVDRNWLGDMLQVQKEKDRTLLTTSKLRIEIPDAACSLAGIRVQSVDSQTIYQFKGLPEADFMPAPVHEKKFWFMVDTPRLIPPEWGAVPPPESYKNDPTSGWDISNNAEDVYIFLLEPGNYENFRKDFLKLTGPTPMPPLYACGLWDSRYHPYTEKTALETIETYRRKQIPLDVFVVDTDWRIGASHGYGVNDSLFPDMERFIKRAHEKHVKLMYNDHPEPQAETALDPMELQYRWDGLTSLFEMGIDVWWYDRNWYTGLLEPMPGISKEVWGMRLYHDITQVYHPDRRPMIMSNVDGIDNGFWNYPSHPASHRYPIWWTGDQQSKWLFLEMGVANGIKSGIHRMMPYVNEDLGGHTGGNPDPEQYIRWVQYGVFSPITRLHCTRGLTRYPWEYGEEAERIASEYIRLRYRLLPVIYGAARQAYEDGTPLMRRCDLEWPEGSAAKRDNKYLFGEDLLVAPIALAKTRDIPTSKNLFHTADGIVGLTGEYFNNIDLHGEPVLMRTDSILNFIWATGSPDAKIDPDSFSVRWTGTIRISEEDATSRFKVISDDGIHVWIGDSLVVDAWRDQAPTDYPLKMDLKPGQTYPVKIEFYENTGGAHFQFLRNIDIEQIYQVWIPTGNWQNIWTGEILQGPQTITINPILWQCPIYVRNGGIIFSLPQIHYTSEHPWNKVIVDAFLPLENMETTRTLYEDDGISPAYQQGAFCKTAVIQSRIGNKIELMINAMKGNYKGALSMRDWVIRFNFPSNKKPENILINGKLPDTHTVKQKLILPDKSQNGNMPFRGEGSPACSMNSSILEISLKKQQTKEPVRIAFRLK